MINAYARNGKSDESVEIFDRMNADTSLTPNHKIYCTLLNAMSHSGDTDQAKNIWNNIADKNIKYSADVNTAYIDCLARKGLIEEAYDAVIELENSNHDLSKSAIELPWTTLLSHSRKYGNDKMTEVIYNDIHQRFGDNVKFMTKIAVLLSRNQMF